jgi:DNA polymerase V
MKQYYDKERRGMYFFIDTKSFYASVEAVAHGFNPLLVPLVVLSTGPNVGGGGLVLATSPMAKKKYHLKNNVSRKYDMPNDPELKIFPPRMNLYITKNLELNRIYKKYTDEESVHPYSIDETLVDLTESWRLFGSHPIQVARKIQEDVFESTGLYTTVGIGDNPIQAKIALDTIAKKNKSLIGQITFETIPDTMWKVKDLTDIWSIGNRTANKLKDLGINNLYDLSHYDPYEIKKIFGIIGSQLYALSWGVDRTDVKNKVKVKSKSLGNSQVLPKDYNDPAELKIVLRELIEQVAARIRFNSLLASVINISIGNEYSETGFHKSMKISPTNSNSELWSYAEYIFEKNYKGDTIRNVSVYYSGLVPDDVYQLNLFVDYQKDEKRVMLDNAVDSIRQKYGFVKLVKTSSTLEGGTAIGRAGLVGGHNGGNSYT